MEYLYVLWSVTIIFGVITCIFPIVLEIRTLLFGNEYQYKIALDLCKSGLVFGAILIFIPISIPICIVLVIMRVMGYNFKKVDEND